MIDHTLNGRPHLVDERGNRLGKGQEQQAAGIAIPHVATFVGRYSGASRTYLHGLFDEALRHSHEDGLAMRRDAYLLSLLQERQLAFTGLPWHLDVPDDREPAQKAVKDTLTRVLRGIPHFRRILGWWADALWFGRYGVQMEYHWTSPPSGRESSKAKPEPGIPGQPAKSDDCDKYKPKRVLSVIDAWPVNGDKIGHDEDHTPYILVNAGVNFPNAKMVSTTRGTAVLLKGTWRERFIIHKHLVEDEDFYAPQQAEAIHGTGIRSKLFWTNFLKMEWLGSITSYFARVGLGVTIWTYPRGNPEALAAVQKAALDQSDRSNIFVPVDPDDTSKKAGSGIERMEVPTGGASELRSLMDMLDGHMERYVVGQEASSQGTGNGLNGEAGANLQANTKRNIQVQDASFLAQTITGTHREPGLLGVIKKYTFPWVDFPVNFAFDVERVESAERLRSAESLLKMGLRIKEDEALAAGGFSKPIEGDDVVEPSRQPGAMPGMPPGAGAPPGMGGAPGMPQPGEAPAPNAEPEAAPMPEPIPEDEPAQAFAREGRPTRYEAVHAPVGGVWLGGKRYEGGEFIPSEAIAAEAAKKGKTTKEVAGDVKRGEHKPAAKESKEEPEPIPMKSKAVRGTMVGARREGAGKESRIVMEDGSPAPAHILPSMVAPAWSDVKISEDPDADVLVTARDKNGRSKTVYSETYENNQMAAKFARTQDGLRQGLEMHAENQTNRFDPALKEHADCVWLMQEQATRPGSDADNKGMSKYYGVEVDAQSFQGDKKKMTISVNEKALPIKDKKTRAEIARRIESGEPLGDSDYWLKSYGATTLEGRHVVEKDDGVYLEFVGKESVWHSHHVGNPKLAEMLLERKVASGDKEKLFGTDYAKVTKYTKTLDGGRFTPKDMRTQRATSLAMEEVARMKRPTTPKERDAAINEVGAIVCGVLGNDKKMALKSYIDPAVFTAWY